MRRINGSAERDQLAYHLGRNDAPEFDVGQPGRIDLARFFIEKMLLKDLRHRPLRIVELGCGAGDISGPYSQGIEYRLPRGPIPTQGIEVIGIDVVPVAAEKIQRRYPGMSVIISPVEELDPIDCDLLVMCEFLEHLADPWPVVNGWMAKADWALIGHPLNEPDPGYEHGHSWSYDEDDWTAWFWANNFHIWEKIKFPMGYWSDMIMGHGSRK